MSESIFHKGQSVTYTDRQGQTTAQVVTRVEMMERYYSDGPAERWYTLAPLGLTIANGDGMREIPVAGDEVSEDGDVIAIVDSVDLEAGTVTLLDGRDFETVMPLSGLRRLDADIDPDRVMGWIIA